MEQKEEAGRRSKTIDRLLGAGIVVLIAASVFLVLSEYPRLWGRCLQLLDTRNWTYATWRAVGVALAVCLLSIRLWPQRKMPHHKENRP